MVHGICGAIYEAAGVKEMEMCCHSMWVKDMQVNEIRITRGFALVRPIIHIYPPIYSEELEPLYKLKECYLKLFDVIKQEQYKSVIVPSLATGFHGYNHEDVAEMVMKLLNDFCSNNKDIDIIFNLYDEETKQIYEQYI